MSEDDENWEALIGEIEEDIENLPEATNAHYIIDLRIKVLQLVAMRNISILIDGARDDIKTMADFCVENWGPVK